MLIDSDFQFQVIATDVDRIKHDEDELHVPWAGAANRREAITIVQTDTGPVEACAPISISGSTASNNGHDALPQKHDRRP